MFERDHIVDFKEKPHREEGESNGGFYVLENKALTTSLDRHTKEHQLMGYRHDRFWSCMDTLREKNCLDELWQSSKAP